MVGIIINGTRVYTGRYLPHDSDPELQKQCNECDGECSVSCPNGGSISERCTAVCKSRAQRRKKRSNWGYWTSGAFFSSSYIDKSIKEVRDVEQADMIKVKAAVEQNSNILLALKADKDDKDRLNKAVCGVSTTLTEDLMMAELRSSQDHLERKADQVLRDCADGRVPDHVPETTLSKLCTAAAESVHCHGPQVRALFTCSLKRPYISLEQINIELGLELNIPIQEIYNASQLYGCIIQPP